MAAEPLWRGPRWSWSEEEEEGSQEDLVTDVPSTPPMEEFITPIMLAFERSSPERHWLHSRDNYMSAFEALMGIYWQENFEERFVPMVRGYSRGWTARVRDDMIFNDDGNLVTFVRVVQEVASEVEMETDTNDEDEVSEGAEEITEGDHADQREMTWTLDAIPQTPGPDHAAWLRVFPDHPAWLDPISDVGTMLHFQGDTPSEYWLHHTATFVEAFELLTNTPMRNEWLHEYTPMVQGAPVEWRQSLRSAFLYNWWNYIMFAPREQEIVRTAEGSRAEGDPRIDERGRAQRAREVAATVRFEAGAGLYEPLPPRGLASWSPSGSATADDAATDVASDLE